MLKDRQVVQIIIRHKSFRLFADLKNERKLEDLKVLRRSPDLKKERKLEDLKVLRRSPDLLNNVKIGQGQLQLLMEQIFFLPYTF